jgi:MOSC domain-containing protein YiiM
MLNPSSPLARLMNGPMRPGVVRWIGLRPAHRAPMLTPTVAVLEAGEGVAGDRWRGKGKGTRQVTLIGAEDLAAIGAYMGLEGPAAPEALRRNFVISGINWRALKERRFRLGEALLEVTGECHPCSRMEETLGPGGYNAVRGHGGVTARVLEGGRVGIGDLIHRQTP